MKRLTMATTLILALALTGCLQHTYVLGDGAPTGEVVYRHWHHHWLFGLIRPKLQRELDIDRLCPSGNAVVRQKTSVANGLVDALTGFIYTPTTVTVVCQLGDAATAVGTVELTAEEALRVAASPDFRQVVREIAPDRLGELDAALEAR